MKLGSFCLVTAAAAALACDPRGVSVGTQELCVADPELVVAEAWSDEPPLSKCARVGENELIGGDFEEPAVTCASSTFCQVPAADVAGWRTSSGVQQIEVWHDGYHGVPAPEGSQFVELDASSPDTLSQDVALPPGQLMYWSFLHRGRNEVEIVELSIGPPEATVSQGLFSSPTDAWYPNSGLYRVGEGEDLTRFELASRSGFLEGNLIDAVVFAPVE
ncbi:MAG: hypothetical protein ABUL60_13875 [Myxococcales bacterium]